jgi:hypothetical protein
VAPVWIYTQSNITSIIFTEYITPTQKKFMITSISKELDSVPKYHILEPT